MDAFDLPPQGSGKPVEGAGTCPCGADRSLTGILMPLLADVRMAMNGSLERAAIQVHACVSCGTLYVIPEAHDAH